MDEETKKELMRIQDDALDVLADLSDILPQEYRLTLVARHHDNEEDMDIVLTNDTMDDAIGALERNKAKMENA